MADKTFTPKKMSKTKFHAFVEAWYDFVVCPDVDCGGPAMLFRTDAADEEEGDLGDPLIICLQCWHNFDPATGEKLTDDEEEDSQAGNRKGG